jgi:TonB family protein
LITAGTLIAPAFLIAAFAIGRADAQTPNACIDAPPRLLTAAQPVTPKEAVEAGVGGLVVVKVSLDEASHITSLTVAKSPSEMLNAAALQAARASVFETRRTSCKHVADTYLLILDFLDH